MVLKDLDQYLLRGDSLFIIPSEIGLTKVSPRLINKSIRMKLWLRFIVLNRYFRVTFFY